MKRKLILIISVIFSVLSTILVAQNPDGVLAYTTSASTSTEVGVINFSDTMLSGPVGIFSKDLAWDGNHLLCGSQTLYVVDPVSKLKVDSIPGVNAIKMEIWNNHLVVISDVDPMFRIYNLSTKLLIFSHDSTWFPNIMNSYRFDMLIVGDYACITYNNKLRIVDIQQSDTLPLIVTPEYYVGLGYNIFIKQMNGNIYIITDYATGAPRFSVCEVDTGSWLVDSLFHLDFYWVPLSPVFFGDNLYVSVYPTHYDIVADTLHVGSGSGMIFPIVFDSAWSYPVFYDMNLHKITYGSQDFALAGSMITESLYIDAICTGSPEPPVKKLYTIYPTVVDDHFVITGGRAGERFDISIYGIDGRLTGNFSDCISGVPVYLSSERGIFIVKVSGAHGIETFKLVKR